MYDDDMSNKRWVDEYFFIYPEFQIQTAMLNIIRKSGNGKTARIF